jgi:uncharacterized membrane protein
MVVWLHHWVAWWSELYADSAVLRTIVGFAHVGALLAGGGSAVAADRGTLLASRRDAGSQLRQALALHAAHRIVIASLFVVTISGVLLLGSDLDTYLHSRVFWIKMALVAVLLANGGLLFLAGERALAGDPHIWPRLRVGAAVSLTLWFAITFLGAALPNV